MTCWPGVALSSGDARRDAALPPRTVFVGIDDEAIVAEAFALLRRRGLAHFAYMHTQEPQDIPRSHRRSAILRRLAEAAGCECAEWRRHPAERTTDETTA